MAALTPVAPKRAANIYTPAAASAGGDTFPNTGRELLLVEHTNGAGSGMTLTIVTTMIVDGEPVGDKTIAIGPGERHLLGPFATNVYNDANGEVGLSYSAVADITIAVVDA